MQTSLLMSFVIKLVTQGREVLRTTTNHMHTIYEEAWQVAWFRWPPSWRFCDWGQVGTNKIAWRNPSWCVAVDFTLL
jgi:hypothetical protein